jgi:hypothetical protein
VTAVTPTTDDTPGLVGQVPAERRWADLAPHREPGWRWLPRKRQLRWILLREHAEPPVSALNPLRDPDPERVGVCCSGGGIRSASFNLGVLQAIQDKGRLQEVEYLAAVSGGSYIAGAVAMVAKTHTSDPDAPRGDDSDPALVTPDAPPFGRGSPEEQYLRNRVSYLAPTGGAKVLLAWRVLLGLLINLTLIGAVVTLVAAVLCIYYRTQNPGLIRPPPVGAAVGATPEGWVWGLGLSLSAVGLVMGAVSILFRPLRRSREDLRRFVEVWSLPLFFFGLVIFLLELVVPELIDVMRENAPAAQVEAKNRIGVGVSASVAGILGAIVVQLRAQIADPGKAIEEAKGRLAKLAPRVRLAFIYFATWVLGPLLIFAMLVAATMVQLESTDLRVEIGVPLVATAVLVAFMRFADINSWSLHPFYRQRLCTAFALRRIKEGDPPRARAVPRKEGEFVPLSETTVMPQAPPFEKTTWPTLIICAAANVSDPGATPPGRGVTSFTFSADEIGGPLVGGIETKRFESALTPKRRRDITLPAAVAMSGAAIAPSMGKFTRPSLRFLLAMANVRTGVWLPNPARIESFVDLRSALKKQAKGILGNTKAQICPTSWFSGEERAGALEDRKAKSRTMPQPSPRYLLKELLGWNSINDKFLYVSDGGHYENLGLVELLRRGCTRIYCFDASGGKPLGTLGDAIALARSELGVEVNFKPGDLANLREGGEGLAQERCATGTVEFTRTSSGSVPSSEQANGTIVYAPTVMTSDLPWDVHAFKQKDGAFPHHSTLDQLFTDQKFEAYRMLGYYAATSAMRAMDSALLDVSGP